MAAAVLTDKAAIKAWANITNTATDTVLDNLALAVNSWVAEYISRPTMDSQAYSSVFNGDGQPVLFMPNRPITAVASVTVNGVAIPAAPGPLEAGFAFDASRIALRGYCFAIGFQNVAITYTAGYTVIPEAIKQAATQLAAFLYAERTRIGKSSETMDQQTTVLIQDVPKDIISLLTPYQNVVPA